jgi:hypothetical protein
MSRLRILFFFFTMCVVFLSFSSSIFAQDPPRFARCDQCGWCDKTQTQPQSAAGLGSELAMKEPGDVQKCEACLYPDFIHVYTNNETLKIDPTTNLQPAPVPGRYYTMLGCIDGGVGGFTSKGAVGGVVQTLLNVVFGLVGTLAFLSIIYGSYIILTSRADPSRLNYGRRVLIGAVIGALFALGSVFIVNFVAGKILKIPGF